MRKKFLITLVTIVIIVFSITGHALRCGSKVISEGDSSSKVKHYCGEPSDVVSYRDYNPVYPYYYGYDDDGGSYDVVEEWTYNFGPQQFMHTLTFRNGKLKKIESGDYGY